MGRRAIVTVLCRPGRTKRGPFGGTNRSEERPTLVLYNTLADLCTHFLEKMHRQIPGFYVCGRLDMGSWHPGVATVVRLTGYRP